MPGPNPLRRTSVTTKALIHKWMHYFDIYHRHFARYRGPAGDGARVRCLHGGSMQMWKDYFVPHARIIGVDINRAVRRVRGPRSRS